MKNQVFNKAKNTFLSNYNYTFDAWKLSVLEIQIYGI